MKKFWLYNLLVTFALLIVFLVILYTIGIYTNIIGHYLAICISVIIGIQTSVNTLLGILKIKQHTPCTALLGIVTILFSLVATLYTWNCIFIQC